MVISPTCLPSRNFRFAASVAAFGQLLRGGKYTGEFSYTDVTKLARGALAEDRDGYRREFVSLVELARTLTPDEPSDKAKVSQIAR